MKLQHLHRAAAAVLIVTGLGAATAHAEGLTVGAGLGVPNYGSGVNGIGGSGSGVSGKVFGGWQFTPNFSLEAGLAGLGHIDNANGTVNGHAEYLDAVGLLPVGGDVSLLGSVGVDHVGLDTTAGDGKGNGLKLGIGAEYAITSRLSLRGEYEHYQASMFGAHPGVGEYTLGVRLGF